MSQRIFPTMPASVCPAEDRLLSSATGPPSAAQRRHARPKQQPSVTTANVRVLKPNPAILPPRGFVLSTRVVFPFYFCTNSSCLGFCPLGTACFSPGGRRGSQGHKAWRLGPDRIGGEMVASAASHANVGMHESYSRTADGRRVHFGSCFFCLRDNLISPRGT